MDSPGGDTVPERRTKSWRREHEETCTRRYLNCQNNGQRTSNSTSSSQRKLTTDASSVSFDKTDACAENSEIHVSTSTSQDYHSERDQQHVLNDPAILQLNCSVTIVDSDNNSGSQRDASTPAQNEHLVVSSDHKAHEQLSEHERGSHEETSTEEIFKCGNTKKNVKLLSDSVGKSIVGTKENKKDPTDIKSVFTDSKKDLPIIERTPECLVNSCSVLNNPNQKQLHEIGDEALAQTSLLVRENKYTTHEREPFLQSVPGQTIGKEHNSRIDENLLDNEKQTYLCSKIRLSSSVTQPDDTAPVQYNSSERSLNENDSGIENRDSQVVPLETYLSNSPDDVCPVFTNSDIIGYTVGSDGKIQVVIPRYKSKMEDKFSLNPDDPDYPEKLSFTSQIIEIEQRIAVKDVLRAVNSNISTHRPDDRYFTKLDSSLKKNTAFVRKLKTFTGNQLENLLKEFLSLNLTKYVSEVAAALVEAKLKMVDVWPAVQLCNIFHGTYSEFSYHLLDNWQKVLTLKKEEKIANAAKLRVDIRFYAELINIGIFTHKEGLPLMGNVLTMLTHSDREEHLNINIVLSFCRHCGDEYAGLVSRKFRHLSEKYNIVIPRCKLLSKEKQRNVKALLKDYFNSMCKHLLKEHLDLQSFIRQNKKILQTKGELSSERKERLESLQTSFDRIANGTQQFAEALDEDLPVLPEDESLKNETLIMNGSSESEEGTLTASLWEDEETRRFYEYLPDMKEFMPSLQVRSVDPEPQITEETLDAEFEGEISCDVAQEEEITLVEVDETEESEPVGNPSNKILLDAFLTALPNCINREMIDSAAVDFVMTLNTKHNRKKLVKTLFNVPRIRLDLLPFYARLVAILHPVMPDVATDLAQMLKQDFKYHVRKKDQMNIESKIKVVRFIGELVKFRMYSKIEGLYCVKVLVQDFTHHHIEMCCNLLESCGRFFFRHPDCHQRMKVYLDQMMRKKAVMALDSRYVTMIENAYYYVNPPESTQFIAKERPIEHQFIRKILYQTLMKSNTDKVLRLMRKLDWLDTEIHAYSVKCLTYAFKVKYFNIRCLASLLAGLATQQEAVGAQVVDGVLEDIRLGMELNLPKYNQRRVAMIKYLGELYNYRMLESSNIFQVLYSLITFGISWEYGVPSPLDPSDNLFRIRLVCVLLETCGQYFVSGMSKKKLDVFLVYFQHYFWFKYSDPVWTAESPFPIGINYMYKDTITSLRPNIQLFTSYTEATEGVVKLRMEETSALLPQCEANTDSEEGSASGEGETEPAATSTSAAAVTVVQLASGTLRSSADCADILEMDDEDNEDEEEEDEDNEDEMHDNIEREDDDDITEQLSGDLDDGEIDWNTNSDAASHMSEGDSQSQELPLSNDIITNGPKLLECPEDEDFLTAFDRMVSDNIQDRMRETVKPQQVDISVPLHIKGSAKKTYDQLREEEEAAKSSVNFILMLRKGHKQQYKSLEVPVNSEMALNLKNREEAERAEKERVKRLTLDINERLEEEDYQEMLAQVQRPAVMNLNRERRHKYQHPKGAPDADLIFGPKKVR